MPINSLNALNGSIQNPTLNSHAIKIDRNSLTTVNSINFTSHEQQTAWDHIHMFHHTPEIKKETLTSDQNKAASSTCHPLQLRMDVYGLVSYLTHGSLVSHDSAPNGISIVSAVSAQYMCVNNTQTNTQKYRPQYMHHLQQ